MGAGQVIGIVMYCVGVPFMTILAIFAMRYGLQAFQARMNAADGGQYQVLAQRAAAVQAETAATLATVKAQLAEITASLASVERVLKQVD
jgi:hypothetical protein